MLGCDIKTPAQRRWVRACVISALLVVVLAISVAVTFRFLHLQGVLAYGAAVLPALPIVWLLTEMGRYLAEEKDEFQRNVLVQCLLGGTGGVLATTTIWGYLEGFVHVRHLNPIWDYPIFWLFVVVSYPVVKLRYR